MPSLLNRTTGNYIMSQTRILAAIVFTYIFGDGVLMGNNDRKVFDILSKNQ